MRWKRRTTSSSSGRAAQGCVPPSRRTTRAPTSRCSRRFTRCGATPGPRRAGSTPRSGTPPRTTPRSTPSTRSRARTTSATRTRSRSSATRRPTTSTSSRTGAPDRRQRPARPPAPRRRADQRAAARDARALDHVRRRRSDRRADPGPAGRPLPHGRRRHRSRRPHVRHGAVRGRRVRLRLRPRCEPARRQRADGDDHLRQARRSGGGRVGAHAHDRGRPAVGRGRYGARAEGAARADGRRAAVGDPRRARADDARELRGLPARGADARAGPDRRGPARALRTRRRRRQGRDLQQRPDPGARARLPPRPRRLHGRRRPRAQGEPGRPRAAARLSRPRRRELPQAHADGARAGRPGSAGLEAGDDDEVAAAGEDVLMAETESLVRSEYATMTVALKIWRFDASTGERELKDYELEAPEWACLLDVLDLIKDRIDGSLAYRKSCRMMICGSCGMRMDGRAVLACKERMKPIVERGHVPVISPMGNLPIIRDLVVDMGPFWNKIHAVKPWLDPGYDEVAEKERIVSQQQMNVIHKEALCIMCGCCVSECNSMESDPEFLGPAALAKGFRFVGDARDQDDVPRLNALNQEHGIWDCTRCYFCNERCPKGVDPRDAIAKLGAESIKEGIDRDMGAKHANWFVTSAKTTGWLRETELVPKTQGVVSAIKQTRFAIDLAKHGKVPPPVPPHVAENVDEARQLYNLVKLQGRDGALGIVQGERAIARYARHDEGEGAPASRDAPEVSPGERPVRGEG